MRKLKQLMTGLLVFALMLTMSASYASIKDVGKTSTKGNSITTVTKLNDVAALAVQNYDLNTVFYENASILKPIELQKQIQSLELVAIMPNILKFNAKTTYGKYRPDKKEYVDYYQYKETSDFKSNLFKPGSNQLTRQTQII